MQKQNVWGVVIAASFALTGMVGCASPASVGQPGAVQSGESASQVQDGAAAALAEEQAMDDYDFMAGQASMAGAYAVMAADQADGHATAGQDRRDAAEAAFKGKLQAEVHDRLQARLAERAERIEDRLSRHEAARAKIRDAAQDAPWVDNGDGTETKTMAFGVQVQVNGQGANRQASMSRTRNIETHDLVASEVRFSISAPSGLSRTATRTKTLNEDGSYSVVFDSEMTFKDGRVRTAHWEKTLGLDGAVAGTGTLTWTDAEGHVTRTAEVTLKGTEDAPEAEAGGQKVKPESAASGEAAVAD